MRAGVSAPVVPRARVLLHERSKSYVHDSEKVPSVVLGSDRLYGNGRLECRSPDRSRRCAGGQAGRQRRGETG